MALKAHWEYVKGELASGAPWPEKLVHVADRATRILRLSPRVAANRRILVTITAPPPPFRGLRDLQVRRGTLADLEPLCAIDETPAELVKARLARGDLAYVGVLEGEVLGHTWFHRGPQPFDEDRTLGSSWALPPSTFWSYNGAATEVARSSGVFAKLFAVALREVFVDHGAKLVQGFIRDSNEASLTMHRRMGFASVGALSTVLLPALKWQRWEPLDGASAPQSWLASRAGQSPLALPPEQT